MAFDSLIGALQSGKVDVVIAGMSVTEERKQNVDFTDEYYDAAQVILIKK
jgi:polar amino acid transport system substrate-binding protein